MSRLPSLDTYDMQGVRLEEAALWGDDVRYAVDDLEHLEWYVLAESIAD